MEEIRLTRWYWVYLSIYTVYISQVVGRMYAINSIDSIDLAKVRYAYAGMFAFLGPGSLNEICVFVLQRAFVLSLLVNCEFMYSTYVVPMIQSWF